MRRDQVNLAQARLWVARLKNSLSVEHPIAGDELRAIKRYLAIRTDKLPWLFVSERGQPLTRQAVNYLIGAAAESAGLKNVHPHTLRHYLPFLTMSSDGPGSGDLSEINRSPRVEAGAITRHSFLDATNG